MVCIACSALGSEALCESCAISLRPAPEQFLAGVGTVRSGYHHRGAARLLVHHLKYRGVLAAGRWLAESMAPLVPSGVLLVPVTRVGWRKLRYGVDPALELSRELGRITGNPVVTALAAPFWGKVRAGRAHGSAPRFRPRPGALNRPALLVDDVITTGATLIAAAGLLADVQGAITATSSIGASRGVGAGKK